jgi:predicted transcriptional regulator/transcriptional regulator with XRE-family HTH domain
MARPAHLGLKVRNLRQARGLSQVEAAGRLGISASYLNLIEHNQRPLTVNLLFKVGQLFDIDLRDWSEGDESRLAANLREVLADPMLATIDVPDSEISEAAVGAPNLVQAVNEMYAAYREAMNNVNTLGDRIAEQAVLPGAAMEVRTVLTSIRSFSEILREHENLDQRQRQQFLSILIDESDRLVSVVEAASDVAEQNRLRATTGRRQPVEEISRFMERHDNHFAELESVAEPLLDGWSSAAFELPGHLARMLEALGVTVRFVDEGEHAIAAEALRINGNAATVEIAAILAGELGGAICRQVIAGLIDEVTVPAVQRPLLERALKTYFSRALLMPYQRFLDDAVAFGYDIDRLAQRYHATPLDIARRLATLHRPGARGVPFHLVVFDTAGNVRERLTGSGMALPRFGSSCPRWQVHRVRADSAEALIDRAEMPDGGVFMCLARDGGRLGGHAGSRVAFSLGCAAARASEVVAFAGRMDLPINPVGVNCRICPRDDCAERAFDSLIGRAG